MHGNHARFRTFIVSVPARSHIATKRVAALMRRVVDVARYERRCLRILVLYLRHYCRNYLGDLIMLTYRTFSNASEAIAYRKENGTGGFIFDPVCNKELGFDAILFPPEFTPSEIFNHVMTRGMSGKLI
jgi:hypothetical protein